MTLHNEDWTADETGAANRSTAYLEVVERIVNEMRETLPDMLGSQSGMKMAGRLIAYASGLDLGTPDSTRFRAFAGTITELLEQEQYILETGNCTGTARVLVSHLAHKYGVKPRTQP